MQREFRFIQGELRAEQDGEKQYLTGYAARFNVLSQDLGYFRERIAPGAFTRSLQEKADVRKLINHDPNLVLGRTKAGTLELSEDDKGLKFRFEMPDTSYARDLMESVRRGDINECSFGFMVRKQTWMEDDDPEEESCIRELNDVDLFDVSTVTYPAYPETNSKIDRSQAAYEMRSLFPDGLPMEIQQHLESRKKENGAEEQNNWKQQAEMRLKLAEVS